MAWFRSKTCGGGTYNTLCVVPIGGLPIFRSETEWCLFYYNSTACGPIKDDAQSRMLTYSLTYHNANGALGVLTVILVSVLHSWCVHGCIVPNLRRVNLLLSLTLATVLQLCLTVNFLEGIITRPIVQKSRESNIPLWLTLPILGCFLTGSITLFSKSSILQRNAGTENFWPGEQQLT